LDTKLPGRVIEIPGFSAIIGEYLEETEGAVFKHPD
jgi:hypothetical protein